MLGKAVIRGTRIPVDLLPPGAERGAAEGDLLDAYPDLQPEDIRASMAYAADAVTMEGTILPETGDRS
jgi:uncharacterized protein (DUF433 family)